jgi:ferredoxin
LQDRLYINPDTCIDCDACLPECPVEAIYSDMSLPEEYSEWLEKNAEAENYPVISTKVPALHGSGCSGPAE